MYFLDTDHLSIADQDSMEGFNLGRRLAAVPPEQVAVTIITYEEQMRGWLAYVARARTPAQQVEAYLKLRKHIERYRRIPVIDYDDRAAAIYERLRKARPRGGTMDLKIAAIALAHDAVLLTRNRADFETIPDLRFEDWSV